MEDLGGARTTLPADLQAPSRAGTYFFDRAGRRVGALVVNPEPSESVLERLSSAELTRQIRARQVLPARDRVQLSSLSYRSAARRSIAEPLLFIALALLIGEALLVASRRPAAAA
jgi:hypothetical protein